MNTSGSDPKDSVTEVAEDSFVRERPTEIERGTVLAGRYQIEDVIGKGGSGVVLRVFDRTAQNLVALKVLKTELARDSKWEKRFSRELRLGRPIQHPNVCRIFDIGEAEGHRFLTMELAHGGSLRDELKRTRAADRPTEKKLADARAVIGGLAALHAAGVVHRDFKPDNLLRMEDGRLVLSDFGLATDAANAPGATVLIGTPHYMAPEVLAGEPATSRSDVWALGVVIHEIFFGQRPERRSVSFDGSARGPLRPASSAERAVLALCERCLADAPFDRPPNAGSVGQMFESARPSRSLVGKGRPTRMLVLGLSMLVLGSVVGLAVKRRQRVIAPAEGKNAANIATIDAVGDSIDWSTSARVVSEVPGRVHCFTLLDSKIARIVWGAPRRAEDVDLTSGKHRPATWAPETYRVGCPKVSPDGQMLLFTGLNQAGAMEIRLSKSKVGDHATTITSGADPEWLGGSDAFVYSVDGSHAAIFSLPTMTSMLLSEPAFGAHQTIFSQVANSNGTVIAQLLYDDRGQGAVAIMTGKMFEEASIASVPIGSEIRFSDYDDTLLISSPATATSTTLVSFDWRHRHAANVGRYGEFALGEVRPVGSQAVVLARRSSRDVWRGDASRPQRLTFDGRNYSAAMSASGRLLLSKRNDADNFMIWLQEPDGTLERLTDGPRDVEPAFSPDGNLWAFVDYTQMSISICSIETKRCRIVRREGLLPSWPVFSPDGKLIAYLTQLDRPKLTVISAGDGSVRASWDAYSQCAPVWSSPTTVWSLESSSGHYVFSERDVAGVKTGNQRDVPNENLEPDEVRCSPRSMSADSPWFRRVRVERAETSRILMLDSLKGAL